MKLTENIEASAWKAPESYRLMTTVRLRTNGVGTGYGCGLAIKEVNGQIVLSHSGRQRV
jgi:hypothetical protein